MFNYCKGNFSEYFQNIHQECVVCVSFLTFYLKRQVKNGRSKFREKWSTNALLCTNEKSETVVKRLCSTDRQTLSNVEKGTEIVNVIRADHVKVVHK